MTKEDLTDTGRIIHDAAIMAGKPVIAGSRIPVERVLAHLANEPNLADLYAAYPELTAEDVKAALAYAHDVVERAGTKQRRTTPVPSAHL